MKFYKYHALGNDYLVLDPKDCPDILDDDAIIRIWRLMEQQALLQMVRKVFKRKMLIILLRNVQKVQMVI